jgi:hypothetical protein
MLTSFTGVTIRLAQSLGLDRVANIPEGGTVTDYSRRKLWYISYMPCPQYCNNSLVDLLQVCRSMER